IAPGDPSASILHQRITSKNPEQKMPPQDSGRELTEGQIQLLADWIRQGAKWKEHWAFVAPERHDPPQTTLKHWRRNPIDDFVLARLEREGLSPSAEASRATLIRRVTLDLTGLPPSPEEVAAFISDPSPEGYESVVDRLLASPHYGEHMAVRWLDAARYADTSGYQTDGPRSMWRWRDWVINAYNSNMPFDQFTVEQLAGDLLESPTLDQRIATAFNRNHRGNAEGGIIPEEYQVEYVVDRVDTTFTVWLGLTMGCARCHDHKYDPIRQKEFYQVFAYFNNIPEQGRAIKVGNSPPYIAAPSPDQQSHLESLDQEIETLTALQKSRQAELAERQQVWETEVSFEQPIDWTVSDGLVNHFSFDGHLTDDVGHADASFGALTPDYAAGRSGNALRFDGTGSLNAGDSAGFGYMDKFTIAFWVYPACNVGTMISRMTPEEQAAGYYLQLQDGRVQVNLINRWLDDAIRVESRQSLPLNQWQHLTVTYDGSRAANGIRVYINAQQIPLEIKLDQINQTFALPMEPLRIGGGQKLFTGALDDVRIFDRDLSPADVQCVAVSETVSEIHALQPESRNDAQREKLSRYFLEHHAPPMFREAAHRLTQLTQERREFLENLPTVMVMEELKQPRETHVLVRGQYDHPAERVEPGVPEVFPSVPPDAPRNRLSLARWLVRPDHPLTARVAVNRFWQMYFGQGLVSTSEDFGAQGESPSHPELLDWLATEFIRLGWDMKALQRLIVTSATYRQASQVSDALYQRDPDNRLLARGTRRRLSAETIRDQALFISGLLTDRIGGPSVKPYQPEGLWREIASDTEYAQDHGDDLYRRSLYTYWKRTVAPPTMVTFDATAREACTVQRARTNTPLQALALMNDVTFVEAARVFAERVMNSTEGSIEERIQQAYMIATARLPRPEELTLLKGRFERSLELFRNDRTAARELLHVGETKVNPASDEAQIAAMTTVTSLILNLDEVVNRE
ncbi:MAG: DUF1553 domain-containing protein, partial [Planctomycetaceae bacterium]|nr:DUF1553 domain-containing protein [Planctomycetaceae bacterium]